MNEMMRGDSMNKAAKTPVALAMALGLVLSACAVPSWADGPADAAKASVASKAAGSEPAPQGVPQSAPAAAAKVASASVGLPSVASRRRPRASGRLRLPRIDAGKFMVVSSEG